MNWRIYYRGSLSSCNYACGYCPFAKTRNTRQDLAVDRAQLDRLVDWCKNQSIPTEYQPGLEILFTPWGEALIHRYYRQALIELSHLPNVAKVCIQTNLSAPVGPLSQASPKLTLWATYHPQQVARERFLAQCRRLMQAEIRFTVGVVGVKEHFEEMAALRAQLPRNIYLWVNAYKREPDYYSSQDLEFLCSIDPHFSLNNKRYPSLHQACRAGHTSFSLDGDGNMRRCHFVAPVIGNIYQPDWRAALQPRPCPNQTCGCYIGYIHQPQLALEQVYGHNLLDRIPANWPAQ